MSLNNVRAVGDDRQWKDEVERELKSVLDIIKYGKITLRAAGAATGGGGGGGSSAGADVITATLPATYDNTTYVVGVDQDAFDHLSSLDYLQFDTTAASSADVGKMVWNNTDGTLEFKLKGGNVTLQVGQEHLVHAKNSTGSTIPDVTAVMFDGASGGKVRVAPAVSTALSEPYAFVGITTEAIADGEIGFVTQFGMINDIDTSVWADGALLYVDPATPGALTDTAPTPPNWNFPVAAVIKSDASTGKILVRAIPGGHVHDLVDAKITTPVANNEVFAYTSATGVWENKTAAEANLATAASPTFTGTVTTPLTTAGYVTTTAGGVLGSVATIPNVGLTNSSVTVAGQSVSLGGSASVSLDNLSDVVITTPATDQVVKYNGTNWVNAAAPGGGGGTVTSITAGTGLSASPSSPITTSGTLNVTDAALNPPGAIIMFGSATPPSGWLLCNGQSTTGYTALAAIVGATVPDLRNRFIVGAGSTYAQGATGGATSHSHNLSNAGYAKGSRSGNRFVYEEVSPVPTWTAVNEILGTGASSTATRTFAIALGGATDATAASGSFLPPYYALTYIIKT